MLIGAHVSTAGGYPKMVDYALSVGCECIQIFAKSPRQWHAKPLDPDRVVQFKTIAAERGLGPVLTHTAYLINLSTDNEEARQKSIDALADEIARASALGAAAVNTHIGSNPGGSREAAKRAADSILAAFERAGGVDSCTKLVLENSAGMGSSFGCSVQELAESIELTGLSSRDLGITIDTCHAWAYGYDVATQKGWNELVGEIDASMGLDRFCWIHANDCKFGRAARKDRHAWIGEGAIGYEGFKVMVGHPALSDVCAVVEMPGEVPQKDLVNIELLKSFRDGPL